MFKSSKNQLNIRFVCIFFSLSHLSPSVHNGPDVLPHPILRSGQPCPLDWLAPSPTTVAAQVSCRALRPVDEWCDPSRAGEPQGWQPGSSCCWGSACCCYLSLIPEPASSGPSRTYLRSKQRDTQQSLNVMFPLSIESKSYRRRKSQPVSEWPHNQTKLEGSEEIITDLIRAFTYVDSIV